MKHFAILTEPTDGHLKMMYALAEGLCACGHRVTMVGPTDLGDDVRRRGFEFHAFAEKEFGPGAIEDQWGQVARLRGVKRQTAMLALHKKYSFYICRDLPALLREQKVDALIADQIILAARFIADVCRIPLLTVCPGLTAIPSKDFEIPLPLSLKGPAQNRIGRFANRLSYYALEIALGPRRRLVNRFARQAGLAPYRNLEETQSPLLRLLQLSKALNFDLPLNDGLYKYVGLVRAPESQTDCEFPWARLDGRPLIFASLGTMQAARSDIVANILASGSSDYQLVVSLGKRNAKVPVAAADKHNTILVPFAPQEKLLAKAAVFITHCGANSVLEALAEGTPILGMPFVDDQPGVAARIRHAGVGLVLNPNEACPQKIQGALSRLLSESHFRTSAQKVQNELRQQDGLNRALQMIEEAVL